MNPFQAKNGQQLNVIRTGALIFCHLLLFVPILELFSELNHIPFPQVIILYFLFTQLALTLIPKWWLWLPVQCAGFIYAFYRSFPYPEAFGADWLRVTAGSLSNQLGLFLRGSINTLPITTGLLLVMALSTLSSLAVLRFRNPWPSFLTCFVYLLILHIFTENQVTDFLLPVLILGTVLIGIARFSPHSQLRTFFYTSIILSAAGFSFTRLALWSTEQFDAQQNAVHAQAISYQQDLESSGFYDWVEAYSNGQAFRRTGYGDNDNTLGGPIQQDFTPVFNAFTDEPHYWRISTKERYTGTGWERDVQQMTKPVQFPFSEFPHPVAEMNELHDPEVISIQVTDDDFRQLPYTYGTEEISSPDTQDGQLIAFQIPSERFLLLETAESKPVDAYQLHVRDRNVEEEQLQEAHLPDWIEREATDYLHVPGSVTQRVKDLALSITEEADTQYEQVKAIEQYLKTHEAFRYSMQDAAFVPDGWDYVDHFLFESQIGYCDHFSTSMAVMLRTLGIPTRWAKGFSSGELVLAEDGTTYRQITNANAHSWPEVYFEGIGWVPFEPTPSFSQPVTETQAIQAEEPVEAVDPAPETDEPEAVIPQETQDFFEETTVTAETEPTPLEAAVEERPVTDAASASGKTEHQLHSPRFVSLAALGTLCVWISFFLVKEKAVIGFMRFILNYPAFPADKVYTLLTYMFERLEKKAPAETIRQYYERWIPFVPEKEQAVQCFISLFEERLYAPSNEKMPLSNKEKEILYEMTQVLSYLFSADAKRTILMKQRSKNA